VLTSVQPDIRRLNQLTDFETSFDLLNIQAERTGTSQEPVFHQFFVSGFGVLDCVDITYGGYAGHLVSGDLLSCSYK
jgi:hypothetical protein